MGINIHELDPIVRAKLAKMIEEPLGDMVAMLRLAARDPQSGISPELAAELTKGLTSTSNADYDHRDVQPPPLLVDLFIKEGQLLKEAITAAKFHDDLPQ